MATWKGLEPSTSSVTGWHSNQTELPGHLVHKPLKAYAARQLYTILEKFSTPISQDYSLVPTNVMKLKQENENLKEVVAKYQEEIDIQQQFMTSASQDLWEELGWQH